MKGRHISRASIRRAARAARVWVNFGGAALGPFPNQDAALRRIDEASGMFRVALILKADGEILSAVWGDME